MSRLRHLGRPLSVPVALVLLLNVCAAARGQDNGAARPPDPGSPTRSRPA